MDKCLSGCAHDSAGAGRPALPISTGTPRLQRFRQQERSFRPLLHGRGGTHVGRRRRVNLSPARSGNQSGGGTDRPRLPAIPARAGNHRRAASRPPLAICHPALAGASLTIEPLAGFYLRSRKPHGRLRGQRLAASGSCLFLLPSRMTVGHFPSERRAALLLRTWRVRPHLQPHTEESYNTRAGGVLVALLAFIPRACGRQNNKRERIPVIELSPARTRDIPCQRRYQLAEFPFSRVYAGDAT